MNDTETYNSSEQERELKLMDKLTKSTELNAMLLNLFYTVSHNLNAYTANIKMLLDLIDLEEDAAENKKNLEYLRTVSNDLTKTITDLSQIVYVQTSADIIKEQLNLHQFLSKVKNIIDGYSIDDRLRFINNVPDDVYVNYNPAYLESILLNFSTNAIKYAHPERFPTIEFGYTVDNREKVLTITDNGLGIDMDRYGKSLFGLNQTFHQHENANGIGLFITKYQIEAMKGKVTVESKVGIGTIFKIHFED